MFSSAGIDYLELEEYGFRTVETIYGERYIEYREHELNFEDEDKGGYSNGK